MLIRVLQILDHYFTRYLVVDDVDRKTITLYLPDTLQRANCILDLEKNKIDAVRFRYRPLKFWQNRKNRRVVYRVGKPFRERIEK